MLKNIFHPKRLSSYMMLLLTITSVVPVVTMGAIWLYLENEATNRTTKEIRDKRITETKIGLRTFAKTITDRITYNAETDKQRLEQSLKKSNDEIYSLIGNIHKVVSHNHTEIKQQRKVVLDIFRSINYASNESKFCVFTEAGICHVHPTDKEKEGKQTSELKSLKGLKIMEWMDEIKEKGTIAKEWHWPKKKGWPKELKMAHFHYYKPLELYIGTVQYFSTWLDFQQDRLLQVMRRSHLTSSNDYSLVILNEKNQVISGIESYMRYSVDINSIPKADEFLIQDNRIFHLGKIPTYNWQILLSHDLTQINEHIANDLAIKNSILSRKIGAVIFFCVTLIIAAFIFSQKLQRNLSQNFDKLKTDIASYIDKSHTDNNIDEPLEIAELQDINESVKKIAIAHHQAEEEKNKLSQQLVQSQKMEVLGMLVGGLAHDLNNLLTSIVSYPDHIIDELPEGSNLKRPVMLIRNAGIKAAAMIEDLLTLARGVACEKNALILNSTIQTFMKSSEFTYLREEYPTIKFKATGKKDLWPINGSETHINKIIVNLVNNAFEVIGKSNAGIVTCEIRNVETTAIIDNFDRIMPGKYVTLSIQDSGTGVTQDELDHIFDPFFSTKETTRSTGSGLGLSIVWNILQDHNAYIAVDSKPDIGTNFTMYFPAISARHLEEIVTATKADDVRGSGERVLIVEDDPTQRELLCDLLKAAGFNIKAVVTGKEAVEEFTNHYYDILVLDMKLNGENGDEIYREILKINPTQRALIVSGYSESRNVKKALDLGAYALLKKPYQKAQLVSMLKKALYTSFNKRRLDKH